MLQKLRGFALLIVFLARQFLVFLLRTVLGWGNVEDYRNNSFLHNEYAPVHDELLIPVALAPDSPPIPKDFPFGIYARNGPNPQFVPKYGHQWFDGDGMIHAVHFRPDGTISYGNKFVKTAKYLAEKEAGTAICNGVVNRDSLFDRIFSVYQRFANGISTPSFNVANTSLKLCNKRILATYEGGLPHQVLLPSLESVGLFDFHKQINQNFTAHPLYDAKTREFLFFGYDVNQPTIKYGIIDERDRLSHYAEFNGPWRTMQHSFAITKHYTVFMFFPLVIGRESITSGKGAMHFDKDRETQFWIVPRYFMTGDSTVRIFRARPGFSLHTANAYEEEDEIILNCCWTNCLDLSLRDYSATLYQYRFNLKTGTVNEGSLRLQRENSAEGTELQINAQFPTINELHSGYKNRYLYAVNMEKSSLIKCDLEQMTFLEYMGSGGQCREGVFVARSGSTTSSSEDNGYLVTFVHKGVANSELHIIDAKTMQLATRVQLPRRIPLGFHGIYVTQQQLDTINAQ